MFRVLGLALLAAILASWVSGGNGAVVAIAFVGVVALVVWQVATGRTRLTCPHCGKRVKLGYSVCHHCGAQVGQPRAIGAPRWNVDEITKACEHCMTWIHPAATACPNCQRDVEAWELRDGTWWQRTEHGLLRLNLHGRDLVWEPVVEQVTPSP